MSKKRSKKKKGRFTTAILIFIFIVGLGLILYPTFSNMWNEHRSTRAMTTYSETVSKISPEEYETYFEEAYVYNEDLLTHTDKFHLSDAQRERYERTLTIDDSYVMGIIEIPSIKVNLPIYHGTSEAVLQHSVGHMEWTSLPVGGESTHCVLSGHRGLPSATLFTHLDRLVIGDYFMLHVLNQTLTYEVDQVLVVEPKDVSALLVEEGEDLCTLVTCTPYGINTHRLLVRGHRIENLNDGAYIVAECMQIDPTIIAAVVGIPLLVLILLFVFLVGPRFGRIDDDDDLEILGVELDPEELLERDLQKQQIRRRRKKHRS